MIAYRTKAVLEFLAGSVRSKFQKHKTTSSQAPRRRQLRQQQQQTTFWEENNLCGVYEIYFLS
jgi:hypothetical protein